MSLELFSRVKLNPSCKGLLKSEERFVQKFFQLKCILIYHVSPTESNGELVFYCAFLSRQHLGSRQYSHTISVDADFTQMPI